MNRTECRQIMGGTLASALLLVIFVLWGLLDGDSLHWQVREDGPIEYGTALLFGLAAVGFGWAAVRSEFLRQKDCGPRYFLIIGWAVLMFVFMGEEISWGQRIFGFETPEALAAINKQNELNVHNIALVDSFLGGKYRYLSVMMWLTGLILPLAARFEPVRRRIQSCAFPVAPVCFWLLFVGAYGYGKTFDGILPRSNDAAEVREFLLSVGMFCFALHGAIRPSDLFRLGDDLTSTRSASSSALPARLALG